MQVYVGMDIGTDKVSPEVRGSIPHHGLDIRKPHEEFSAFDFRQHALSCIRSIHERGHLPIIVGGSGLYIKALLDGLAPYPAGSKAIRESLNHLCKQQGLVALYQKLQQIDPDRTASIHPHDKRRIIRALEIYEQSGVQPSALQKHTDSLERLGYSPLLIGIRRSRHELYQRVNERVDAMIEQGLVNEVLALKDHLSCTTAHAVGYKEVIAYDEGKQSLADAIAQIKKHSRQLVKKQLIWFRKEKRIVWIDIASHECALESCNTIYKRVESWLSS